VAARGAASNDMDSGGCGSGPGDREGLGRSRGGMTTKVHLAADTRCRPVSRVTSAGQRHDLLAFGPVLAGVRIRRRSGGRPRTRARPGAGRQGVLEPADPNLPMSKGIKAAIPEPTDQIAARKAKGRHGGRPPAFDPDIYKRRNTVEPAINKLREVRAVGTRYDKSSAAPSTSRASVSGSVLQRYLACRGG
jgi:hypothetical protein